MKLKISYFNPTVFRKNLARFAPVWGLPAALTLINTFSSLTASLGDRSDFLQYICSSSSGVGVFPFIYAFVCALVLFGDLYKTSLCNALHAMPLRREGWMLTNLVSGIVFYLITILPTTLLQTVCMLVGPEPGFWYIPLLGTLCDILCFICFLGIAAFSALCVGKRLALTMVYYLLNVGIMLVYWILDTLYAAQLYGVQIEEDIFTNLMPFAHTEYVVALFDDRRIHFVLGEYMPDILAIALVGVVMMAVAMLLYRRRNLECAGDFMSVRFLEPVFLILYTAVFCAVFSEMATPYLIIGIALGFFTGMMLIKRTVRVFQPKVFLGAAVSIAVVLGSIFITDWDPFGIEDWVPDVDEVKSVTLYESSSKDYCDRITLEHPEQIEDILFIHERVLIEKLGEDDIWPYGHPNSIILEYHLEDGSEVSRYYYLESGTRDDNTAQSYFDSVLCLLETNDFDRDLIAGRIEPKVEFQNTDGLGVHLTVSGEKNRERLVDALIADLEDGNLPQPGITREEKPICTMDLGRYSNDEYVIDIYADCENTLKFLRKYDSEFDDFMEMKYD